MKHFKLIALTNLILFLLLSACKKDDDNLTDKFPILGTCTPVAFTGNLSQSSTDNIITYITRGGGKIKIDGYTFFYSHKYFADFNIVFRGFEHEDFNGKHIKDFLGNRRSLIFPDGAKITIVNAELNKSIKSFSIVDGEEYHHYNFTCNKLEFSSVKSPYAEGLDYEEVDGETATFEITETEILYYNIYTENRPGIKIENKIPLARLFKDNPIQVYDLYDDPRLKNT